MTTTTRKDVARLASVSEATVSRVFNDVGPLREETKQRVLAAAKTLGYHPHAIASRFARGRSGNIGVVLPYVPKVRLFSAYYFSEILSGIGETIRELGYDLLLLFRTPGETVDYVPLYRSGKVDACIMLGASDSPEMLEALDGLAREKLPFCLINQHYEKRSFNEIDAEHFRGSYKAVRHLIAHGYRRIAYLNGPVDFSNSRERLAGYRRALEEAGLPVLDEVLGTGNYGRKSGYEAAFRLEGRRSEVEAVFAANDRMAIGLMQGMRELDLAPGRDIAIAGYDDSDAARVTDPPLTTVQVPFYEMGRMAAEKLLAQWDDKAAEPFAERLQTELIIRTSCGCQ